jgi:hypothetical protein
MNELDQLGVALIAMQLKQRPNNPCPEIEELITNET